MRMYWPDTNMISSFVGVIISILIIVLMIKLIIRGVHYHDHHYGNFHDYYNGENRTKLLSLSDGIIITELSLQD